LLDYKEHPAFGPYFEMIKKQIVFPDFLPSIMKFYVDRKYVYAFTYFSDSLSSEVLKFDIKGKLKKRYKVPVLWKTATMQYPFTINNGKAYQVVKNEKRKWEIREILM